MKEPTLGGQGSGGGCAGGEGWARVRRRRGGGVWGVSPSFGDGGELAEEQGILSAQRAGVGSLIGVRSVQGKGCLSVGAGNEVAGVET